MTVRRRDQPRFGQLCRHTGEITNPRPWPRPTAAISCSCLGFQPRRRGDQRSNRRLRSRLDRSNQPCFDSVLTAHRGTGAHGLRRGFDGCDAPFISEATNLVVDTNGWIDVFVYDRRYGPYQLCFGQFRRRTGEQQVVQLLSRRVNGRFVAFYLNSSTNLVAGDTNGQHDVLSFTTATGKATPSSVTSSTPAPRPFPAQPFAPRAASAPCNGRLRRI